MYAVSNRIPVVCIGFSFQNRTQQFDEHGEHDRAERIRIGLRDPGRCMEAGLVKQAVEKGLIFPTQRATEFAELRLDFVDDVGVGRDALAHPAPSAIGRPWPSWWENVR